MNTLPVPFEAPKGSSEDLPNGPPSTSEGAIISGHMTPFGLETYSCELPEGLSIQAILDLLFPLKEQQEKVAAIYINDIPVPPTLYSRVKPKPGTKLILKLIPGDGDALKGILITVAIIALATYGAHLALEAQFGAPLAKSGWLAATGITKGYALTAVISTALFAWYASTLPVPSSRKTERDAAKSLITGIQNTRNPYGPIPKVYGAHRIYPLKAANDFTEVEGDNQFLRALLTVGYAPGEFTELKIDNTPLSAFADVELETRGNPGLAGVLRGSMRSNIAGLNRANSLGTSFAFAMWMRIITLHAGANRSLFAIGDPGTNPPLAVDINNDRLRLSTWFNGHRTTLIDTSVTNPLVQLNTWHHFGVIVRNSKVYLYLDGELQGESDWVSNNTENLRDTQIGAQVTHAHIDQCVWWNNASTLDMYSVYERDGLPLHDTQTDRIVGRLEFDEYPTTSQEVNPPADFFAANSHTNVPTEFVEGYAIKTYPHTLYTFDVNEQRFNTTLTASAGWVTRRTNQRSNEISVDITFAAGLVSFGRRGGKDNRRVNFEIRWRLVTGDSTGDWSVVRTLTKTSRSTSAVILSFREKVAEGFYDVSIRRTTPDSTSTSVVDRASWTVLRSIATQDPVNMEGLATIALRIRATDQLDRVVDNLSTVFKAYHPVHTPSTLASAEEWTQSEDDPLWFTIRQVGTTGNWRIFAYTTPFGLGTPIRFGTHEFESRSTGVDAAFLITFDAVNNRFFAVEHHHNDALTILELYLTPGDITRSESFYTQATVTTRNIIFNLSNPVSPEPLVLNGMIVDPTNRNAIIIAYNNVLKFISPDGTLLGTFTFTQNSAGNINLIEVNNRIYVISSDNDNTDGTSQIFLYKMTTSYNTAGHALAPTFQQLGGNRAGMSLGRGQSNSRIGYMSLDPDNYGVTETDNFICGGARVTITNPTATTPEVSITRSRNRVYFPTVPVSPLINVSTSNKWRYEHTSNPAWQVIDTLHSRASAKPLGYDRFILQDFITWAAYCDQTTLNPPASIDGTTLNPVTTSVTPYTFNYVHDDRSPLIELANKIATSGKASLDVRDGWYTVALDSPGKTPVQHFGPRNSSDFTGLRQYENIPQGVRVQFIDPNNIVSPWEQDERLVYLPGYDETNANDIHQLKLDGITNADLAWRHGRFYLGAMKLRSERFTITVDIEGLVAHRGDAVYLSHDVPLIGISTARIVSIQRSTNGAHITGITLDDISSFQAGKTYQVVIRTNNNDRLVLPLTTTTGAYKELVFSTPLDVNSASLPNVGDLCFVGETERVQLKCLVAGIENAANLSATLTLIPLEDILHYGEILEDIPSFNPLITLPTSITPPQPTIEWIQSGREVREQVLGRFSLGAPRILLSVITPGPTLFNAHFEVQYRLHEPEDAADPNAVQDPWIELPNIPTTTKRIYIGNVEEREHYEIHIRTVQLGVSSPWTTVIHQVGTADDIPPDVTNIFLEHESTNPSIRWTYPDPPPDVIGFEVRTQFGSYPTWELAQTYANIPINAGHLVVQSDLPPAHSIVMVKAIDAGGNESENPAILVYTTQFSEDLRVFHSQLESTGGWHGTIIDNQGTTSRIAPNAGPLESTHTAENRFWKQDNLGRWFFGTIPTSVENALEGANPTAVQLQAALDANDVEEVTSRITFLDNNNQVPTDPSAVTRIHFQWDGSRHPDDHSRNVFLATTADINASTINQFSITYRQTPNPFSTGIPTIPTIHKQITDVSGVVWNIWGLAFDGTDESFDRIRSVALNIDTTQSHYSTFASAASALLADTRQYWSNDSSFPFYLSGSWSAIEYITESYRPRNVKMGTDISFGNGLVVMVQFKKTTDPDDAWLPWLGYADDVDTSAHYHFRIVMCPEITQGADTETTDDDLGRPAVIDDIRYVSYGVLSETSYENITIEITTDPDAEEGTTYTASTRIAAAANEFIRIDNITATLTGSPAGNPTISVTDKNHVTGPLLTVTNALSSVTVDVRITGLRR